MFPNLPDVDAMNRDLKDLLLGIGDLLAAKMDHSYTKEQEASDRWEQMAEKHRQTPRGRRR